MLHSEAGRGVRAGCPRSALRRRAGGRRRRCAHGRELGGQRPDDDRGANRPSPGDDRVSSLPEGLASLPEIAIGIIGYGMMGKAHSYK